MKWGLDYLLLQMFRAPAIVIKHIIIKATAVMNSSLQNTLLLLQINFI